MADEATPYLAHTLDLDRTAAMYTSPMMLRERFPRGCQQTSSIMSMAPSRALAISKNPVKTR